MKKLLGILVLGLLLSGNAYAEKIVFSSNDFIIVDLETDGADNGIWENYYRTVFGTGYWSIHFKNIRMPSIAENHCKNLGKNAYLLGQGGKHFEAGGVDGRDVYLDWYTYAGFVKGFTLVRYYCAKNKDEAFQNFRKTIGTKKFDGVKKFKSRLEKKGKNLFNDNNLIWVTNDKNAKTLWASRVEPKKIAKKPEKKKPKPSPDNNKVVAASMGSGFFVTRAGHIVTNHHVIDQCKAVKVNYKGDEIPAKILASDKTNDLAIIQAKITPNKVYPVSSEDASLLQDVIVAGFPLGKKVSAVIKTHKGSITALAGFGDNFSNFQTDATINQGNSGGPIINLKGNVVGVAVQLIAAEHAQNIFFGVKSSTLKTFANAKGINFLPPNHREMSNENLSKLITEATVYLECWMTVAKIKQIIAQEENRKAFYTEFK